MCSWYMYMYIGWYQTSHLFLSSLSSLPLFPTHYLQRAKAHYQTMEAEYTTQVTKLQKLVDSSVDPMQFVQSSGDCHMTYVTVCHMTYM